jgi:hypothetical protein
MIGAPSRRHGETALAYVYFEDEPTRRGLSKRLSSAERQGGRADDRAGADSRSRESRNKVTAPLFAKNRSWRCFPPFLLYRMACPLRLLGPTTFSPRGPLAQLWADE